MQFHDLINNSNNHYPKRPIIVQTLESSKTERERRYKLPPFSHSQGRGLILTSTAFTARGSLTSAKTILLTQPNLPRAPEWKLLLFMDCMWNTKGRGEWEDRVGSRQMNTLYIQRMKGQKEIERMEQKIIQNKIRRERHEYMSLCNSMHIETHPFSLAR